MHWQLVGIMTVTFYIKAVSGLNQNIDCQHLRLKNDVMAVAHQSCMNMKDKRN